MESSSELCESPTATGCRISGGFPATPTNQAAPVNLADIDADDEFQDAYDLDAIPATNGQMDLDKALDECKLAINLFFNNKFVEARALMQPWATTSMYHSVGNCVFAFLEAMLTFEQHHIAGAAEALKLCMAVCQRHRKKSTLTESIGKTFKRPNYEQYSELEVHAELCMAESLLLKSMLTFVEDETLTSFIRGGIKIRTCFFSFKECSNILAGRSWTSDTSKVHFESGVRMGMGTFNLMISMMPARVIKLLEFIGFSGNKQAGMQDLIAGYRMSGIRQVLCVMTLLGYNLIVCYVLSHQEGDLDFCDEILNTQLTMYPNGVWFLFFKGRLEFMKGNLDESLVWYKRSWKSQDVWPQFHHLCFWELLWVNCIRLDWREAQSFATLLLENSKWSRTIYSYQKAVIMLMMGAQLTDADRKTVADLMREVPRYKQRIAGKSLPMEKFVIKKADRFFAQQQSLVLPCIELMFLWNSFKVLGKRFELADGVYQLVERELIALNERTTGPDRYDADNRALILLLKGACLRQMKSPLQALKCFETVISLHKDIREDAYVVPYAIVELGLLYVDQGRRENAIAALEDAKKNYTGYSLESRLHFRIHTALTELKGNKNGDYVTSSAD